MIEIKNLKKEINNKKEHYPIISNISLILDNTGITFINSDDVNKNLINILLGFDKDYDGEIRANGKLIKNFNDYEYDIYRTNYISYIPLKTILLEDSTIKANIKMAGELKGKSIKKLTLNSLLLRLNLSEYQNNIGSDADRYNEKVIDIGRAIAKNSSVLLVDNPNLSLNNNDANLIYKLLKDVAKDKQVIIFTNDESAARTYGNRYIEIRKGVITKDTNPISEVKNNKPFEFEPTKLFKKYSNSLGVTLLTYNKLLTFLLIMLSTLTLFSFIVKKSISDINFNDYHKIILDNNNENEIKIAKYNTKMMYNESIKNNFEVSKDISKIKGLKIPLSNDLINQIEKYTKKEYVKEYKIAKDGKNLFLTFPNIVEENEIYFNKNLEINLINFTIKDILSDDLFGSVPSNNDEIIISKYIAESIIKGGIDTEDGSIFKPRSLYQIINYAGKIKIANLGYFKIVGIVNTDTSIYKDIKNLGHDVYDVSNKYLSLYNQLDYDIKSNYSRIYFNNGYIDTLKFKNNKSTLKTKLENGSYVNSFNYITSPIKAYNGREIESYTSLTDRVIIIDLDILNMNTNFDYELRLNKALSTNNNLDVTKFTKDYINNNNIIGSRLRINLKNNVISSDQYTEYFIGAVDINNSNGNITFSKNVVNKLINSGKEVYSLYYISKDNNDLNSVIDKFSFDNDTLLLSSKYSDNILSITNILYVLNYTVTTICKFTIPFIVILLALFIYLSYKKSDRLYTMFRYLGITKRSMNSVYKGAIRSICVTIILLTGLAVYFFINYLNKYFTSLITIKSTILSINIVSSLLMFVVLVVVYILSTRILKIMTNTRKDINIIKKVQ